MSRRKITQEEIILRFKRVHGDKYDYSKVTYQDYYTKVKIGCPIHGYYEQCPSEHLAGCGCPKCGRLIAREKLNLGANKFIEKSIKIHNDKYNYNKAVYVNNSTPIEIVCPIHGSFWQNPASHVRGAGCPECSNEHRRQKLSIGLDKFIERSQQVHNFKYGYEKSRYIDCETKIEICCPLHGNFWQRPMDHMSGMGCPKCGGRCKSSTLEFIDKANKIHNNAYNYSKVNYINNHTNIIITCPIHGDFTQLPGNHLKGAGCPKCKESQGERKIRDYLEAHNIRFEAQKRFTNCKDKRTLPFDFYLPDYNMCIEFNGVQHYKRNEQFMRNEEKYDYMKNHDYIKKEYCKKENIRLVIIPYTQLNTINKILNQIL